MCAFSARRSSQIWWNLDMRFGKTAALRRAAQPYWVSSVRTCDPAGVGVISHAWYASTPMPSALQAIRSFGTNSSTRERIATPNVRQVNTRPAARSGLLPSRTTFEAFGYHAGQSGAATSHAQTASGGAAASISFAT